MSSTEAQARSGEHHEPGLTERVSERPQIRLSKIREIEPRHLGFRFLSGAATSVAAGLITLWLGPRTGGIFLAFPAILAASLTLIAEQEDREDAREDARGAILGGAAMVVFAAVVALTVRSLGGAPALVLATLAWFAVALIGYLLAWFR
jgi:Protein of unknown function (DUF3147)